MTALFVRDVDEADNDALLALARATTTGSDRFAVDRAPDYFAFGRAIADDGGLLHVGAFDATGDLVGTAGVARRGAAHYVHDLRVRPRERGTGVARAMLGHLARRLRERTSWYFATVLAENAHAPAILRGFVGGFESPSLLAETSHVGLPLFGRTGRARADVVEITRAEHEVHHARLAGAAPWPKIAGRALAVVRGSSVLAVARLSIGEPGRRFIAQRGLPGRTVLAAVARASGAAPPPRAGEELKIGYLAAYAGAPELDLEMRRFVMRERSGAMTWLFRGMPRALAVRRRFPLGTVRLASSTWAFGEGAHDVDHLHELTLI